MLTAPNGILVDIGEVIKHHLWRAIWLWSPRQFRQGGGPQRHSLRGPRLSPKL